MPGRIDFTMDFNTHGAGQERDNDMSYRVYVLGNFSGRPDLSWQQRKISKIDVDNFDQVMAQVLPTLELDSGLNLRFQTLDDFHPDGWLEKIQILADLQKLKIELSNPNTAAQAAAKIRAFFPAETTVGSAIPAADDAESTEDTLERLLGKKSEIPIGITNTVDKLIDHMVSPFVTKPDDPQYQALIKLIDTAISQFLRTLLHSPDFQSLEALWMATEALVQEESADQHSFYLVNISKAELLAELENGNTEFEQKLLQHIHTGDGEQDVVLIGDYDFSDSANDKDLLAFCSRLAKACGAFFLAGAERALIENAIGATEKLESWHQYLNQICADRVMLTYPRYLLRLPYGAKSDPIEALPFEECSAIPLTQELLWGNPAFICARVLIKTAQRANTAEPFFFGDIPAFSFEQDGVPVLQPGTQAVLNESQANTLLSQGIMPLIGYRQRRGVRIMGLSFLSGAKR